MSVVSQRRSLVNARTCLSGAKCTRRFGQVALTGTGVTTPPIPRAYERGPSMTTLGRKPSRVVGPTRRKAMCSDGSNGGSGWRQTRWMTLLAEHHPGTCHALRRVRCALPGAGNSRAVAVPRSADVAGHTSDHQGVCFSVGIQHTIGRRQGHLSTLSHPCKGVAVLACGAARLSRRVHAR